MVSQNMISVKKDIKMLNLPEVVSDEEINYIHTTIGKNIKRLRKQKGISQLEMALSIGQKAVSFYVNAENVSNKKRFNIEHLVKIAKVLDVDIRELFNPNFDDC